MPIRVHWRFLVYSILFTLGSVGCTSKQPATSASDPESAASGAKYTFAIVPKGTQASFWNSVHKGVRRAAEEFQVEVIWKGPERDNDRAAQKKVLQQFIAQGVDGIAFAPLDSKSLLPEAQSAMAKKLPVVIFDSALDGEQGKDYLGMVATDNFEGGRLGAQHLVQLISSHGKAVMLRHQVGHASTAKREDGALEVLLEAGIDMLSHNRYGGATVGETQRVAMNMIETVKLADGIFAPNETTSEGMLLALRQNNMAGKIRFVGFDASPLLVEGLKKGEIDALVVQNPERMGYLSVKLLVDHLEGRPIEPFTDTGASLVTRENMNDPDIARLLQ